MNEQKLPFYKRKVNKVLSKEKDIDLRNYAKYVLKEGAITEKREVLGCLKSELVLKDGKVVVKYD